MLVVYCPFLKKYCLPDIVFTVCCTVLANVGKGGGLAEDDVMLSIAFPKNFPIFSPVK